MSAGYIAYEAFESPIPNAPHFLAWLSDVNALNLAHRSVDASPELAIYFGIKDPGLTRKVAMPKAMCASLSISPCTISASLQFQCNPGRFGRPVSFGQIALSCWLVVGWLLVDRGTGHVQEG